jgi:hypothetical protein
MTTIAVATSIHRRDSMSLVDLQSCLGTSNQAALKALATALPPPFSADYAGRAIANSVTALIAFQQSLTLKSKDLDEWVQAISSLLAAIETDTDGSSLDTRQPSIWRGLARYPAWRLLTQPAIATLPSDLLQGIGAEFALALARNRPIRKSFATAALSFIKHDAPVGIPIYRRDLDIALASTLKKARRYFQQGCDGEEPLCDALRGALFFRQKYCRDQTQQRVFDHRCVAEGQIPAVAAHLALNLDIDPDRAGLTFFCAWAQLAPDLARRVPLLSKATGDWVVAVDELSGILKLDMKVIAPDAATPIGTGGEVEQTSTILVRPMPTILRDHIQRRAKEKPTAETIGQLFEAPAVTSRDVLCAIGTDTSAIPPTLARFTNSLSIYAVQQGIRGEQAAYATGDFRIIPKAKLYYLSLRREQIWDACRSLYASLGWGEPVPLEPGLSSGSQVVPTKPQITTWHLWMKESVTGSHPGRNSRVDTLLSHHNNFIKASGSILALTLALRPRDPYPLFSNRLINGSECIDLSDKGPTNRDSIPLCKVAAEQVRLLYAHYAALQRRLSKLNLENAMNVVAMLEKILSGAAVPLLITIGPDLECTPLSSSDLTSWWPPHLKMVDNFGRHFLQTELTQFGLSSRDIDAFVRHHMPGAPAWSTSSSRDYATWSNRARGALDKLFNHVGVVAINGLVKADHHA